jgi:hypothetical protein
MALPLPLAASTNISELDFETNMFLDHASIKMGKGNDLIQHQKLMFKFNPVTITLNNDRKNN